MKDIGYYAGFSTPERQEEINKATMGQLVDLISDISGNLYFELGNLDEACCSVEEPLSNHWQFESHRDKLALIRGLCDRIELKLMETAKLAHYQPAYSYSQDPRSCQDPKTQYSSNPPCEK